MLFLKRADYIEDIAKGKISAKGNYAFPIKSGALCEVATIGGQRMFKNGRTIFNNGGLATYAEDHGIEGVVLVHHKFIRMGIPKWLTYNHHRKPFETWSKDIELYTLGCKPISSGDIPINVIDPITVTQNTLSKTVDDLSLDPEFDGLLIEGSRPGVYYSIKATRYIEGIIRDVDYAHDGPVITVTAMYNGYKHVIIIKQMTRTMRDAVDSQGKELLGKRVKIQYTSYLSGERFANFGAPSALYPIEGD